MIRRVPACDGTNPDAIRLWLREVDMTITYTPLTTFVAAQTATGILRHAVEKFLNRQPDRERVGWPALRKHITSAFLSPHEDDRLRNELKAIKRGPYESVSSYGMRFSEAAELAYPPQQINPESLREADMNRILLNMYLKGLNNKALTTRLMREVNPSHYEEAITYINKYESDDYRVSSALDEPVTTYGPHEEPMEIGAINSQPPQQPKPQNERMDDMERRMTGMSTTITKMMAILERQVLGDRPTSQQQTQSGQSTKYDYKFTDTGRPICHFCQKVGHIAKECRSRLRQRRGGSTDSQQNQGGR
jgi:hypothetical protein